MVNLYDEWQSGLHSWSSLWKGMKKLEGFAKGLVVHCLESLGNIKQLSDRGKEKRIAPSYLFITFYFIPCLLKEVCVSLLRY